MNFILYFIGFVCGFLLGILMSAQEIGDTISQCKTSQMEWGGKYYKCVEVVPEYKEKK